MPAVPPRSAYAHSQRLRDNNIVGQLSRLVDCRPNDLHKELLHLFFETIRKRNRLLDAIIRGETTAVAETSAFFNKRKELRPHWWSPRVPLPKMSGELWQLIGSSGYGYERENAEYLDVIVRATYPLRYIVEPAVESNYE